MKQKKGRCPNLAVCPNIPDPILLIYSFLFSACPKLKQRDFPHIIIEAGPRSIGTVRNLQCEPGLQPMGYGAIECQSDATWSPLDFVCMCKYEKKTMY